MPDAANTLIAFNALITEGINVLSTLSELLEREHHALTERDLEAIGQINQAKHEALNLFDINNQNRAQLLLDLDITNDKAGITTLLTQSSDSTSKKLFKEQWQTLESVLKSVMDANKRNELILMRQRQSLEQFMGVLQGQKPANKLYTAKGATGNYTGQSRLGKA